MGTGKGRIAILMAIYEPRMDWLREQLMSLEGQTYPDLTLYIRDDCSSQASFAEAERCVKQCIRSFPYVIRRNETNLGSNGTFERLTAEAEGEYFAYCDQDDVWLPEKLVVLQDKFVESGAQLVCSDMYVIDKDGKRTADSITKVHHRHIFYEGSGLAPYLMVRNFISGCAMLVQADIAKAAIPFVEGYVYDQWLGMVAASQGTISVVHAPLISHRLHGDNQTGLLAGINSKMDYYNIRIEQYLSRFESARSRLALSEDETREADRIWEEMAARKEYYIHPGLKKLRTFAHSKVLSRQMVWFEAVLPFMTEKTAAKMLHYLKSSRL